MKENSRVIVLIVPPITALSHCDTVIVLSSFVVNDNVKAERLDNLEVCFVVLELASSVLMRAVYHRNKVDN